MVILWARLEKSNFFKDSLIFKIFTYFFKVTLNSNIDETPFLSSFSGKVSDTLPPGVGGLNTKWASK